MDWTDEQVIDYSRKENRDLVNKLIQDEMNTFGDSFKKMIQT